MASNMLKSAHFPPYSRTEPATMAGRPAQAFFGSATNSGGAKLTYKIVWMKLDATHAAVMARMAAVGASAEETNALDALAGRVRVVGVR